MSADTGLISVLKMELGQLLREQTEVQDGPSPAPSSIPALQKAQATAGLMGLTGASTGMTGPTTVPAAGSVTALSPAPKVASPTGLILFPSLCHSF